MMGGDVTEASEPGRSVFTLRLPAGAAAAVPASTLVPGPGASEPWAKAVGPVTVGRAPGKIPRPAFPVLALARHVFLRCIRRHYGRSRLRCIRRHYGRGRLRGGRRGCCELGWRGRCGGDRGGKWGHAVRKSHDGLRIEGRRSVALADRWLNEPMKGNGKDDIYAQATSDHRQGGCSPMPYPPHAHLLPREIHNGLSTISRASGDDGSISESKIRIPRPVPASAPLLTRADEVVEYRERA
jgi:hypothetical protein